jgi:hypothetical protein
MEWNIDSSHSCDIREYGMIGGRLKDLRTGIIIETVFAHFILILF